MCSLRQFLIILSLLFCFLCNASRADENLSPATLSVPVASTPWIKAATPSGEKDSVVRFSSTSGDLLPTWDNHPHPTSPLKGEEWRDPLGQSSGLYRSKPEEFRQNPFHVEVSGQGSKLRLGDTRLSASPYLGTAAISGLEYTYGSGAFKVRALAGRRTRGNPESAFSSQVAGLQVEKDSPFSTISLGLVSTKEDAPSLSQYLQGQTYDNMVWNLAGSFRLTPSFLVDGELVLSQTRRHFGSQDAFSGGASNLGLRFKGKLWDANARYRRRSRTFFSAQSGNQENFEEFTASLAHSPSGPLSLRIGYDRSLLEHGGLFDKAYYVEGPWASLSVNAGHNIVIGRKYRIERFRTTGKRRTGQPMAGTSQKWSVRFRKPVRLGEWTLHPLVVYRESDLISPSGDHGREELLRFQLLFKMQDKTELTYASDNAFHDPFGEPFGFQRITTWNLSRPVNRRGDTLGIRFSTRTEGDPSRSSRAAAGQLRFTTKF
ncbi:MAG: hypothetical protein HYU64_05490 [Armatimonadetes bacterium]|nr:hypothetical protein [Armatimonadota bacterium]